MEGVEDRVRAFRRFSPGQPSDPIEDSRVLGARSRTSTQDSKTCGFVPKMFDKLARFSIFDLS